MNSQIDQAGTSLALDEHEKELQSLLLRLMAKPLAPLADRLADVEQRISEMEQKLEALPQAQADEADKLHVKLKKDLHELRGELLAPNGPLAAIRGSIEEGRQCQIEAIERLFRGMASTRSDIRDWFNASSVELAEGFRAQVNAVAELGAESRRQSEQSELLAMQKHQILAETLSLQTEKLTAGHAAVRNEIAQSSKHILKWTAAMVVSVGIVCTAVLVVLRHFVWNPTVTMTPGRRARWACVQAAGRPVHMSTRRV